MHFIEKLRNKWIHLIKLVSGKIRMTISILRTSLSNGLGQLNTTGALPPTESMSRKVLEAAKILPVPSDSRAIRSMLETFSREAFSMRASNRGLVSVLEKFRFLALSSGTGRIFLFQIKLFSFHSRVARVGLTPASRSKGPSKRAKVAPLGT